MMAVLLALSLISPMFLPRIFTSSGTTSVLLMGLAVGLPTGILEELGWTAFAIPRLRLRHGVLVTGLIVASGRMGACQWRCSCMQALQLPQLFSSLRWP